MLLNFPEVYSITYCTDNLWSVNEFSSDENIFSLRIRLKLFTVPRKIHQYHILMICALYGYRYQVLLPEYG